MTIKRRLSIFKKELWGPMYEPLKDTDYFKQVFVDNDYITIQWPNGADFSPDRLYEMGKEVKAEPTKKTQQQSTSKPTQIRKKAAAKSLNRK